MRQTILSASFCPFFADVFNIKHYDSLLLSYNNLLHIMYCHITTPSKVVFFEAHLKFGKQQNEKNPKPIMLRLTCAVVVVRN